MLKHIVFWKLREAAAGRSTLENAREMKSRLEALNGRIPGLIRLEVGIDISCTTSSADIALYSEFTDRQALDAYQTHPEHVAVGEFVGAACSDRILVDYEA